MTRVPDTTVERLPAYLRYLDSAKDKGIGVVNSQMIAKAAGTNAAQVRKDLSRLGELGMRGVGYDPAVLAAHLARVMGLERPRRVAVVGCGRLGGALVSYLGRADRGFEVVSILDTDPEKIGTRIAGVVVRSYAELAEVLRQARAEMVILTTPAESAQEIVTSVAQAGVRSILSFAPVALDAPDGVTVRRVDLSAELQVLAFHLMRTAEGH